jgi:GAF domain-containing protein
MTSDGHEAASSSAAVRDEGALADTFVMLADTLVDDYDVVDFLHALANASVGLLHAAAAGILLVDQRGGLAVVASSTEESRLLEVFQLQNNEGPCLDCVTGAAPVVSGDLSRDESRWPRFVPAAAGCGFQSVIAVPMRLRHDVVGGLNLFYAEAQPVPSPEQRIAQALADVATIGILQQRAAHRSLALAEQLQQALNSRVAIEQAKGVLAERNGIGMDAAFAGLRRQARERNMKLTELAVAVVRGDIDPLTP